MESFGKNQDYSQSSVWERLYDQTERWKDESNFFEEEFQFLHDLIGGYLVWLGQEENFDRTRDLVKKLNSLNMQNKALSRRITGQMIALEELQNGSFVGDKPKVKKNSAAIRSKLEDFIEDFRNLKKEVHHLTRIVTRTEKFNQFKKT